MNHTKQGRARQHAAQSTSHLLRNNALTCVQLTSHVLKHCCKHGQLPCKVPETSVFCRSKSSILLASAGIAAAARLLNRGQSARQVASRLLPMLLLTLGTNHSLCRRQAAKQHVQLPLCGCCC